MIVTLITQVNHLRFSFSESSRKIFTNTIPKVKNRDLLVQGLIFAKIFSEGIYRSFNGFRKAKEWKTKQFAGRFVQNAKDLVKENAGSKRVCDFAMKTN